MISSFKELKEKYEHHPKVQAIIKELKEKDLNELLKIKEKSREILKELTEEGVTDDEDKEFLFECVVRLAASRMILDNGMNSLLGRQEEKLVKLIPAGFDLNVLLHPDFPYTLHLTEEDREKVLLRHQEIMRKKKEELERLKSLPNYDEIKKELDKLDFILRMSALDEKNEKRDLELINKALSLLGSGPL